MPISSVSPSMLFDGRLDRVAVNLWGDESVSVPAGKEWYVNFIPGGNNETTSVQVKIMARSLYLSKDEGPGTGSMTVLLPSGQSLETVGSNVRAVVTGFEKEEN